MAHRSWGPPCKGTIKTVVLSNGVKLPVRQELAELIAILATWTLRRGYRLVPGWCWGYACRKIRGSSTWSNHAWGLAVDLNAPTNPMKRPKTTDMPPWMPEMWKRYGFRWGGDYTRTPDTMHYEFMGSVADAKRMTEQARKDFALWEKEFGDGGDPSDTTRPTLRRGMSGQHVRHLQELLGITVDGDFGPLTEAAVKDFQRDEGITVDGICGSQTWEHLESPDEAEPVPEDPGRPYPGYGGRYGGYNREEFEGKLDGNVRWIQERLNAHSPPSRQITVDGYFGPATETRVKQFQRAKGLTVDGVVGPSTWGRLE